MSWRLVICAAVLFAACASAPTTAHAPSPVGATTPTVGVVTPTAITSPTPAPVVAGNYANAQPAPPAPAGKAGAIHGRLNTPADVTVEQAVYAITLDGRSYYRTDTVRYQAAYTIAGVAAGDYVVYSLALDRSAPSPGDPPLTFNAAYTKAVGCGLAPCRDDHTLVTVHVTAGAATTGIDPEDWYSAGYPLVPGEPLVADVQRPAGYASPQAAAAAAGGITLSARQVGAQSDCPVNTACFALDAAVHVGNNAAYMTGTGGSNQDVQRCTFFALHAAPGWEPWGVDCGPATPVPVLGAPAHVYRGKVAVDKACVNVHSSPNLSSTVTACLVDATAVVIDGGPDWVQTGAPDNYYVGVMWWHLTGRGWINGANLFA